MKKIILLTSLLGVLAFHLSAQTKAEKITELFLLMKTEKMMNAMIDNMASLFQHKVSKPSSARKDSIFNAFVKEETIAFLKKSQETVMVELYDKYFTIAEIRKYIDFYKTPEGQKMLDLGPVIQKDLMSSMMTKDMPELQEKFRKKLEEIGD